MRTSLTRVERQRDEETYRGTKTAIKTGRESRGGGWKRSLDTILLVVYQGQPKPLAPHLG